MDKHYYSPENIEAFIGNKLSIDDRLGFEDAMAKDPLLKNEVDLQSDIIQSLKDSRKAELKARLNSIDVSTGSQFVGLKIAASIVAAGLLSFGIYSFFNSKETKSPDLVENPTNKEVVSTPADNTVSASEAVQSPAPATVAESAKATAESKKTKLDAKAIASNPAPIAVPQPAEMENEQFQSDGSIAIPDGKIAQETNTKNNIDIKEDNTTSNKFHYQFYNNKLFLYGNFSEKTYEILELNTYKGKQVYLYYDKKYYLLKSNQLDVTGLKEITDKKVLSEIEKLK